MNKTCWLVAIVFLYSISILVSIVLMMFMIGFVMGKHCTCDVQKEVQKNILNFLRSKGYDDALTSGGGSTSS